MGAKSKVHFVLGRRHFTVPHVALSMMDGSELDPPGRITTCSSTLWGSATESGLQMLQGFVRVRQSDGCLRIG